MKIETVIANFVRSRSSSLPIFSRTLLEQDLIAEGYLDSLGVVLLISYIEEYYQIELSEDEIQSKEFRTLIGIASLIQKRMLTSPSI